MSTNISSNPFPLGYISPGSSYATISSPITANYTDLSDRVVDSIIFRGISSSSGTIYICNTSAPPDTTNYLNVIDVITNGAYSANSSAAMNTIKLSDIYIGASDATSGALVTVRFR